MKFLGYQVLAIGIIWAGMAFFFSKMDGAGKIIFYVVTSWLLFLIVLLLKQLVTKRQFGPDEPKK
ncbi:hypothetical protein DX933_17685 [Ornithinibacillus gellani]|uniref:hypothetical protein n=1 Tax=Ornithinibacillus gellani TaxID=2293253 RepID=UPI000F46257D|nr:hypothetical protein [Ornithinibacillus gellani]TQS70593.1 hypothetical protein DX933_17685 [Ornithinibacillus gellani]